VASRCGKQDSFQLYVAPSVSSSGTWVPSLSGVDISQHSPGHTKALTAQRTGKYKNMTVWIAKIYPNWY